MFRPTAIVLAILLTISISATTWSQAVENPYEAVPQSRTDDGAFVLGNRDAKMRFIEFSDFLCGHCQNYESVVETFIQQFVLTGQAQIEYRMFPVVDPVLSPQSAALAECADTLAPGSFWFAHDLIFEIATEDGFTETSSTQLAERLGLDHPELVECAATATQYRTDQLYGLELDVQGTPSLFVQYGDSAPIAIAHALPEHFAALVNAVRPDRSVPVEIEDGPYAGISTFRRADGSFVLGSPDASLTIVAFEDFLCLHCQNYVETVHSFIESQVRTGLAQFEYRFYPLIDPQHSVQTTRIAECVAHLDITKFWDAHDVLFELASARKIGAESSKDVAGLLDLDVEALAECMDRSIQFLIDTKLGHKQDVSGTPAIRARRDGSEPAVIYSGQQALDRGAVDLEVLIALAEGSPAVTIGPPEPTALDSTMLPDISLLTKEPCGPPCWQNITPGETVMEEALKIVSALESIKIAQATDADIVFGYESGAVCCQIVSDDQGVVVAIVLQLAPQVLVGEAIATLGEPMYVTGMPFSANEHLLVMVFPEKSAFLYAMVAGADGMLSQISPIVSAIYGSEEQLDQVISTTPLDDWKGYLSYNEYMDGVFDNSP